MDGLKDISEKDPAVLGGSGTEDDPFILDFAPDDPANAQNFPKRRKWLILVVIAVATLAVGFASSAYTGAAIFLMERFQAKEIVITLGVSLFVLGFALGPLVWAPASETVGRSKIFIVSYIPFVAFGAACGGVKNITGLLILRFLQGTFGSSAMVNPGGIIADMFDANERGIAIAIFASMPFLGPVLGPICGGFVGEYAGYQWVFYMMAIFAAVMTILQIAIVPETYAPYLIDQAARRRSLETGRVYVSKYLAGKPKQTLFKKLQVSLHQPFILLFMEPIVSLLSIYMAIIYGTLYLEFTAFPIVFQVERGWKPGIGGLAFIGIGVGMLLGALTVFLWNKRYVRQAKEHGGVAPPELRLEMSLLGGILLPIGLFWFAWTTYPNIHWIVPIIGTIPFGWGMVVLFLSMMSYLVETYLMHAASALAANSVLRSLFGFAFPLFSPNMYANLGTQWASCLVAFLALACVPLPFLFFHYGARIRKLSKHAPEDLHTLMLKRRAAEAALAAQLHKEEISGGDDEATLQGRSQAASQINVYEVRRDQARGGEIENGKGNDAAVSVSDAS
ncbi:hypothetical protein JAAARDRAFT_182267 [Jaapia argillacea MUCL 33604]|uniref:Major facilitator superfamily (MFS) profile domain-containing protein n=1 Tax=Jaapia argillacea MUCL 33604 TaxID=933084 RepID=A0A067PKB1_9AGAM|nr:hypothetical protein JAAARDRAFT_182267 [Jaapia argillacea MUCL 33604]